MASSSCLHILSSLIDLCRVVLSPTWLNIIIDNNMCCIHSAFTLDHWSLNRILTSLSKQLIHVCYNLPNQNECPHWHDFAFTDYEHCIIYLYKTSVYNTKFIVEVSPAIHSYLTIWQRLQRSSSLLIITLLQVLNFTNIIVLTMFVN